MLPQALRVAVNHRQGGFQLVGQVRDHLAPGFLRSLGIVQRSVEPGNFVFVLVQLVMGGLILADQQGNLLPPQGIPVPVGQVNPAQLHPALKLRQRLGQVFSNAAPNEQNSQQRQDSCGQIDFPQEPYGDFQRTGPHRGQQGEVRLWQGLLWAVQVIPGIVREFFGAEHHHAPQIVHLAACPKVSCGALALGDLGQQQVQQAGVGFSLIADRPLGFVLGHERPGAVDGDKLLGRVHAALDCHSPGCLKGHRCGVGRAGPGARGGGGALPFTPLRGGRLG